ncbi:MAG: MoxR family ATPase [Pseudomonadota bacterium]
MHVAKRYYEGKGVRRGQVELPYVDPHKLKDPEHYIATPELAAAVDVALTLGMPLLLTGEPGCGKSGLAASVAWELRLDQPLEFVVKSDTEARDLFYRFDSVGRFHAGKDADAAQYITFEALGKAILHARESTYATNDLNVPANAVDHPGKPKRSVVLIDEIDKAPRDVPNDMLVEIDQLQFDIPELAGADRTDVRVRLDESRDDKDAEPNQLRPLVIFTSNSEKGLPEPFLRRCVYHHVQFPPFANDNEHQGDGEEPDVTVEQIVMRRLSDRFATTAPTEAEAIRDQALSFFQSVRQSAERKPGLAELLNWLDFSMPVEEPIEQWSLRALTENGHPREEALRHGVQTLLLKTDDAELAGRLLAQWRGRGSS